MTGQQWSVAITMAMYAHGPVPNIDQVCTVAALCYPRAWTPQRSKLERMVAHFQLAEALKLAAYRREVALELGEPDVEAIEMFGALPE